MINLKAFEPQFNNIWVEFHIANTIFERYGIWPIECRQDCIYSQPDSLRAHSNSHRLTHKKNAHLCEHA